MQKTRYDDPYHTVLSEVLYEIRELEGATIPQNGLLYMALGEARCHFAEEQAEALKDAEDAIEQMYFLSQLGGTTTRVNTKFEKRLNSAWERAKESESACARPNST